MWIDYNNSPRGAALTYYFTDNIDIFATVGKNTFNTRTNPAVLEPNIYIDNETKLTEYNSIDNVDPILGGYNPLWDCSWLLINN